MKLLISRIMLLILIEVLFLGAPSVYAETVHLKSGEVVEGKLIEKTDKYIKIDFQGVPIIYYINEITSIDGQPPILSSETKEGLPEGNIAEKISDNYKEANKIYPEAMKLISEGKIDAGLDLFKQTTVIAPEEPDIHMNYGSMLFTRGQQLFQTREQEKGRAVFKEAENELLLAVKLYKENPSKDKGHLPMAQCNFLLGDIYYYVYNEKDKAKSFYQKSLELYPEHQDARNALKRITDDSFAQGAQGLSIEKGVELGRKGMFGEAIIEFTKIINAEPNNANAYYNRGLAYRMKGDIDQAITDYGKAIEISPNSPNLYNVRAIANFSKQNYTKSWDDVHKCQELGGYIDPKFIEELKKLSGRDS